jgi:hypothetical protein
MPSAIEHRGSQPRYCRAFAGGVGPAAVTRAPPHVDGPDRPVRRTVEASTSSRTVVPVPRLSRIAGLIPASTQAEAIVLPMKPAPPRDKNLHVHVPACRPIAPSYSAVRSRRHA